MRKLNGINDLIPFLNYLEQHKIYYSLSRVGDDAVMVTLTLVGFRIEVDFAENFVGYSIFEGSEDVLEDHGRLFDLIAKHI
jgi:hypothetical protein